MAGLSGECMGVSVGTGEAKAGVGDCTGSHESGGRSAGGRVAGEHITVYVCEVVAISVVVNDGVVRGQRAGDGEVAATLEGQ